MHTIINALLVFLLFTLALQSPGQSKSTNGNEIILGSWKVCQEMKFVKNHNCDQEGDIFTFLKDGSYSEHQNYPKHNINVTLYGKWTLAGVQLTLDLDDTPQNKYNPYKEIIHWLSPDLFYYSGREGPNGPMVYTYFQRMK